MRIVTNLKRFYAAVFMAVLFLVLTAGVSHASAGLTDPSLDSLDAIGTITDPSKDNARVLNSHSFIFSALPLESDSSFEDNNRNKKSPQSAEKYYYIVPCSPAVSKFSPSPSDRAKISILPSINYAKTTRKRE